MRSRGSGGWTAKLALQNRVHAAIDLDGPIGATAATIDVAALPNGMAGIAGNALGLDAAPSSRDAERFSAGFFLRAQGLLERPSQSPLLVINGTDDPYVPRKDSTVFRSFQHSTVWMINHSGHLIAT